MGNICVYSPMRLTLPRGLQSTSSYVLMPSVMLLIVVDSPRISNCVLVVEESPLLITQRGEDKVSSSAKLEQEI